MKRLGAKEVVVLGGKGAVSNAVVKELKHEGFKVRRIEGQSRFDTAAKIASEVSPDGAAEVVIANGMDFPDALSVAAHAAKEGLPILLTQKDALPKATKDAIANLKATNSLVIGGKAAVTKEVERLLPKVTRLSGSDRYKTNVAVNKHFGLDSKHLYVATGQNYADALTGGVLAAKGESAILLVHHKVPKDVSAYIKAKKVKRLTIFGGENAVSEDVVNDLKKSTSIASDRK